jgi:hypothetical protein
MILEIDGERVEADPNKVVQVLAALRGAINDQVQESEIKIISAPESEIGLVQEMIDEIQSYHQDIQEEELWLTI